MKVRGVGDVKRLGHERPGKNIPLVMPEGLCSLEQG